MFLPRTFLIENQLLAPIQHLCPLCSLEKRWNYDREKKSNFVTNDPKSLLFSFTFNPTALRPYHHLLFQYFCGNRNAKIHNYSSNLCIISWPALSLPNFSKVVFLRITDFWRLTISTRFALHLQLQHFQRFSLNQCSVAIFILDHSYSINTL